MGRAAGASDQVCTTYRRIGRVPGCLAIHQPRARRYDSHAESLRELNDAGIPPAKRVSLLSMADYYPLIARAVAGLDKNSGENRRALYERARTALLTQLRGVTPTLDEFDITRERLALEELIRKVEAEAARKFADGKRPPPPRIRPIEPRAAPDVEEPSMPAPRRSVDTSAARQEDLRRPRPPSPAPGRPTPPLPIQSRSPAQEPRREANSSNVNPPPPQLPLRGPAERGVGWEPGGKFVRQPVPNGVDLEETSARAKSPRDGFRSFPADLDRGPRLRDRGEDRQQDQQKVQHQEYLEDRQQDRLRYDPHEPQMLEPQSPQAPAFEPRDQGYQHNDFSEPMLKSSFALDDASPISTKGRRAPPARAEHAELDHPSGRRGALAWRPSRELSRGTCGRFPGAGFCRRICLAMAEHGRALPHDARACRGGYARCSTLGLAV